MSSGSSSGGRRLLAVLLPLAVPWFLVVSGDRLLLGGAPGLVDLASLRATSLLELASAPGRERAVTYWLVADALYLLAVGSAAAGLFGREDRRVTAGLLVLAGVSVAWSAADLSYALRRTAVPVGTVVLFGVAYWTYAAGSEHEPAS